MNIKISKALATEVNEVLPMIAALLVVYTVSYTLVLMVLFTLFDSILFFIEHFLNIVIFEGCTFRWDFDLGRTFISTYPGAIQTAAKIAIFLLFTCVCRLKGSFKESLRYTLDFDRYK